MEITSGGLVRCLLPEGACCPKGEPNSDTILVYARTPLPGTLRKMLSGLFGRPKGVSLRGSTVYVARINKAGQMRMARPCEACWRKLKGWGVKEVVYTTDNEGWKREKVM